MREKKEGKGERVRERVREKGEGKKKKRGSERVGSIKTQKRK